MSRCIDADALEELFREVIGGIAKKPEMNSDLEHMVRASAMVIEMIQDAPTIEPERKKGEWIDRGWSGDGRGNSWHEWECSECKHITKGAKWDFCPNCGADMRKDGATNADVES